MLATAERLTHTPSPLVREALLTEKTAGHFEVLTPHQFLWDFRKESARAKRRLYGQAMEMHAGFCVDTIADCFVDAAQRAVDTRVHIDTYTLAHEKWGDKAMFTKLQRADVRLTFTNIPKTLPEKLLHQLGRNHIKMAIVDDAAYVGGLNFNDENFRSADFMVKITDPQMVEALVDVFHKVNYQKPQEDYEVAFADGTRLLVDAGKRGESLILDTAVQLIDKAKDTVHTTTLLAPDGKLLDALYKAHQGGIIVEVLTSHPKKIYDLFGLVNLGNHALMQLKKKNVPMRFSREDLHAKSLLVDAELADRAVALFGSHNLSEHGVQMRTEEIAIVSRDPRLIANLRRFCKNLREKTIPASDYSLLSILGGGKPRSAKRATNCAITGFGSKKRNER